MFTLTNQNFKPTLKRALSTSTKLFTMISQEPTPVKEFFEVYTENKDGLKKEEYERLLETIRSKGWLTERGQSKHQIISVISGISMPMIIYGLWNDTLIYPTLFAMLAVNGWSSANIDKESQQLYRLVKSLPPSNDEDY